MKLTKKQIKQIIEEQLKNELNERVQSDKKIGKGNPLGLGKKPGGTTSGVGGMFWRGDTTEDLDLALEMIEVTVRRARKQLQSGRGRPDEIVGAAVNRINKFIGRIVQATGGKSIGKEEQEYERYIKSLQKEGWVSIGPGIPEDLYKKITVNGRVKKVPGFQMGNMVMLDYAFGQHVQAYGTKGAKLILITDQALEGNKKQVRIPFPEKVRYSGFSAVDVQLPGGGQVVAVMARE